MPAASCSASATRTASRCPSTRRSGGRAQGAHSLFGVASQEGLGKLPTIVVSSMENLLARDRLIADGGAAVQGMPIDPALRRVLLLRAVAHLVGGTFDV